jgi:hypothetical protein
VFHDALKAAISTTYSKTSTELAESKFSIAYGEPWPTRMQEYIPKIRRLLHMSSVSQKLGFDLVLYLGRHSYTDSPRKRTSRKTLDKSADDLLAGLAMAIKEDPDFN